MQGMNQSDHDSLSEHERTVDARDPDLILLAPPLYALWGQSSALDYVAFSVSSSQDLCLAEELRARNEQW